MVILITSSQRLQRCEAKLYMATNSTFKQFSLAMLLGIQATNIAASDSITWMVYDWEPWQYFDADEQQFKGYAIEWQNYISAELTRYRHQTQMMNDTRMLKQFKSGKRVCNFGAEPGGDVAKVAYLSKPVAATVDLVIFTHKTTFEQIGRPRELSINDLLSRPVGFPMEPGNFPWLAAHAKHSNLTLVKTSNPSKSMFRMLDKGRISFAIDYLVEGQATQRSLGLDDQLSSILLSETKDLWVGVIACSKTSWGKQVIEDINRVLPKVVSSKKYSSIYERYLDSATLPHYRQAFQRSVIDAQAAVEQ